MRQFISFISLMFFLSVSFTANAVGLKAYTGKVTNPVLVLKDLNGVEHNLEQYRGSVVLVQFWATYCTPCRKEMPSMNNMQKKLEKAGVPFKILAIDMGETKQEVERFVKIVKPEFTILMDETGENTQKWNVFAAPSNFIIDPKGKIKYTLFGGVEWDSNEIIETITSLAK